MFSDFVLVNREDGSVDFAQPWDEYKAGFGNVGGECWLGLQNAHQLTTNNNYSLVVDMEDFEGNSYQSQYSSFAVGPESGNYILTISGYNETSSGGDSIIKDFGYNYKSDMMFTTIDRDNDGWGSGNCAAIKGDLGLVKILLSRGSANAN